MSLSCFVVGDIHFKHRSLDEGEKYCERLVSIAEEKEPDLIVLLGDILDDHEVIRTQPFNMACDLITSLSEIAPVYLLIGNHDYINNSQYMSTNHPFNVLKGKDNIEIIDQARLIKIQDLSFIFCPYVPPGSFMTALKRINKFESVIKTVSCVFAHQEFRGCQMGEIKSTMGDVWPANYPPVISGHIHEPQVIGTNIYYPGSSRQTNFGESPDKKVWNVSFEKKQETMVYEAIDLGLRNKKTVSFHIDDIKSFDTSLVDKYDVRVNLKGSLESLTGFRKTKAYSNLVSLGVKVNFEPEKTQSKEFTELKTEKMNFRDILHQLVLKSKDKFIQKAYHTISS